MRRKNEDEDRDESAAACGRQGGDLRRSHCRFLPAKLPSRLLLIADFFPPNCRVDFYCRCLGLGKLFLERNTVEEESERYSLLIICSSSTDRVGCVSVACPHLPAAYRRSCLHSHTVSLASSCINQFYR
jgi:hypothetical protein